MIWLFLRRERLLRYLPLALLLALWPGGLILRIFLHDAPSAYEGWEGSVILDSSAYEGSVDPHATRRLLYTAICGWSLLYTWAMFSLLMPLRQRVHEYERALPAARRDIVLGKLGAIAVFLGSSLLVGFLVVMSSGLVAPGQWLALGAQLFTSLVLALLCFASYRPERDRLGVLETVTVSVLALVVIYLPTRWGGEWLPLVYLLVSVGLGVRLFRRLGQPSEWQLASASSPGERELVPWRALFHPLRWTVLRSTVLRPSTLLCLAALVIYSGLPELRHHVYQLIILSMWISAPTRLGLGTLREFGALPYSRPSFVRHCTWPALVALLMGLSTGFFITAEGWRYDAVGPGVFIGRYSEDTLAGGGDLQEHLRVPAGLWSFAHGGAAPVIEAPFGEVFEPTFHPFWEGSDLGFYNPYDIDDDCSVRYMTWQVSRALAAAGIDQLSPEEVHARWFSDLAKETKLDDLSYGSLDDRRRPWGGAVAAHWPLQHAGAVGLLGLLVWGGAVAFTLFISLPPGIGSIAVYRRKILVFVIFAGLFALSIGVDEYMRGDSALPPVLFSLLARGFDTPLGGSALAWLGLNLGLFLVLDRVLLRMAVHIDPPVVRNGLTGREFSAY